MHPRYPLALAALLANLAGCAPEESTGESVGYGTEITKDEFFSHDAMYYVRIEGWDPARMTPASLFDESTHAGAKLRIYKSDANSGRHCPDGEGDLVHETTSFSIRTSGNFTNGTPKSSYKIEFKGDAARFLKMKSINLKSMWNDVSQMREALAWELFEKAQVPASGHGYARFCINDRYYGLYSVIEQVNKQMLKDHFDDLDEGNLYKAYWEDADLGPADLTYKNVNGDDDGSVYHRVSDIDHRTYQLKSNEDDEALASYDDLATFIKTLNGKAGAADFNSAAFEQQIEAIFDVRAFLRWASVNNLLGAWDNYWGTPANYYLYNGGRDADFMGKPYFSWLPWDYDNSFGIDYFGVPWHEVGIVDWAKHTRTTTHALPLVTNLLKNDTYLAYYLDHMECMIERYFNPEWIDDQIGDDNGSRGLWPLIKKSVYLESDSPTGAAHTGRQFTNDQVYWNGFQHHELRQGTTFILGIHHHVNARHDSAKSQIAHWRSERNLPAASEPVCE